MSVLMSSYGVCSTFVRVHLCCGEQAALLTFHGNRTDHPKTVYDEVTYVPSFLCQAPRSSGASSVLGSRQEERVSLSLPGFDDDDDNDEDRISENEVTYLQTNSTR